VSDEESRPIGPILDQLGISIPLAENERVTDAVVIARCVDLSDGSVRLGVFESPTSTGSPPSG
jgi:hypothetical protein